MFLLWLLPIFEGRVVCETGICLTTWVPNGSENARKTCQNKVKTGLEAGSSGCTRRQLNSCAKSRQQGPNMDSSCAQHGPNSYSHGPRPRSTQNAHRPKSWAMGEELGLKAMCQLYQCAPCIAMRQIFCNSTGFNRAVGLNRVQLLWPMVFSKRSWLGGVDFVLPMTQCFLCATWKGLQWTCNGNTR